MDSQPPSHTGRALPGIFMKMFKRDESFKVVFLVEKKGKSLEALITFLSTGRSPSVSLSTSLLRKRELIKLFNVVLSTNSSGSMASL